MSDLTTPDALEPLLPDGAQPLVSAREIARRLGDAVHLAVTGVRGSAASWIAARVMAALPPTTEDAPPPPLWVLCATSEEVELVARDLAFALPREVKAWASLGERAVLRFLPNDASPYAEVHPERRAQLDRMATLHALGANGTRVGALVTTLEAMHRRVIARDILQAATVEIAVSEDLDRAALAAQLVEAGYVRAPLVEDRGTFAFRGSLIDVWPPQSVNPFRVELDGDLVAQIRAFDAADQKTRGAGPDLLAMPPVREVVLTPANAQRARQRVRELADAIDYPTSKTRALEADVSDGRMFFGGEAFLPAYYDHLGALGDYAPQNAVFVLTDPAVAAVKWREVRERAEEEAQRLTTPHFMPESFFVAEERVLELVRAHRTLSMTATRVLGESDPFATLAAGEPLHVGALDQSALVRAMKAARSRATKSTSLAPLAARLTQYKDHGLAVTLAARSQTQGERLATLLQHHKVAVSSAWSNGVSAGEREGREGVVELALGPIARGVVLPAEGFAVITEEDLFGTRVERRRARKDGSKTKAFLDDLSSLNVGDFVVHEDHGIGRYAGLVHRQVGATTVDLIAVEYAGGDKLYLPVYRLNQVQKYKAEGAGAPKLDRLGGSTFAKTKARVEKEVRKMADELLRLYAERTAVARDPLPQIDDDYRAFEATFPFEETPDQARAIDDVNGDFERSHPMDRLVCGDVGFGKTEVAIRAAYRAASNGRQVALLCPTTVLAQQHFRVLETRLADYALNVKVLSRFQTAREHTETLVGLREGKVDIVVGTHRLLSKDVRFKNLGLLVVDEEQRFGVGHKERLKQLRTQVDVLTLSATPIPRTLQMATSGIRDLSLIATAPVDRRAVRTIVTRYDAGVLREAIEREIERGGQVFYVYNRIEGLHERANKIAQLVPRARVAVAHGQQVGHARGSRGGKGRNKTAAAQSEDENDDGGPRTTLERTMLDFVDGQYDVLAATAIIESGLDIPRANTIIIDRADMFGLAQLYQLRGRVGRSKERAYCYLVVPDADALSDEARSRIEALERHTELGSGFKVASLDMELRGAGDLLGAEQSGTVATVGFELFVRMLEDAVSEMKGEVVVHDIDPELSFDVEALIPEDYVSEVGVRLSFYKRLASASDEPEVLDIAGELENRFGPPPREVSSLVRLMVLKTELRKLRVVACEATQKSATLALSQDSPLDAELVLNLVRGKNSAYKLSPDMRLSRRFEQAGDALSNADAVLSDLARCLKN